MAKFNGFFSTRKKRQAQKKEKTGLGTRLRQLWFLLKLAAVVGLIGFIAAAYYGSRVDRLIADKFDRARKWDLPSRVYSDSEYIYPGQDIEAKGLMAKLDRLQYRNTGETIKGPGDYARTKTSLSIWLHDFSYPNEKFTGFPVTITLTGTTVADIKNSQTGETLALIKIEPEEIASILNDKMEDRTLITLNQVPQKLVEAIILIEDERFFEHKGVDPVGIARAACVNVASMRIAQGGSTLTQQLVKNYFLYSKKSFSRKLNEMFIAHRIEKTHTKAEILEAYLNEIYLGQRGANSVSGVSEASKLYFGKNVDQITLGESAILAGMIKNPSKFNPISHPENALERRDFILKKMYETGLATKQEYAAALAENIVTPKKTERVAPAPYFVDFVKRQLADLYPPEILQTEGLRIFTTLDMSLQLSAEASLRYGLQGIEKEFSKVLPKEHPEQLQGCIIAIQPATGYLRALTGGRDYGLTQFDRCTQAQRQPGSTFKPFVYLTAVDPERSKEKFTPASLIEDEEFEVRSGGEMWSPQNYDKKTHGNVTLQKALEQSYNISAARLAIRAGLENVVETARDAGITSKVEAVPSLALGAFEVSPIEMASAYTIFPNGGVRTNPISIIGVVTKEGEVLERKEVTMKREFDEAPVFVTTHMMKGVMDRGTGASARSMGFTAPAAGKTGTTSSYKDAWFVGFTPDLLSLVWLGYDDNAAINLSGGRAALPIWTSFMKKATPAGSGDFSGPGDVVLLKVDPITGGLSSPQCPAAIEEAFIEGTEPTQKCDEIKLH